MKKYTIPFYKACGGNNKETLRSAIDLLYVQYVRECDILDDFEKINLLDTIVELNNIYLSMEEFNEVNYINSKSDMLLRIIEGYGRMIDRSGKEFPTVVLDDIRKSIDFVIEKNK